MLLDTLLKKRIIPFILWGGWIRHQDVIYSKFYPKYVSYWKECPYILDKHIAYVNDEAVTVLS